VARTTLTTPRGIAVYPRLSTPDTKFNKDGLYTIRVRLDQEQVEVQKFLTAMTQQHKEAVDKARSELPKAKQKSMKIADLPWKKDEAEDGTESIVMNFKMLSKITSKKTGESWTQRPAVFDAAGKPLAKELRVGGGSVVKVAFEVNPFYTGALGAGLSLRLKAVQVLELVEWQGGTASSFGFESVAEEEDETGTPDEATLETDSAEDGEEDVEF